MFSIPPVVVALLLVVSSLLVRECRGFSPPLFTAAPSSSLSSRRTRRRRYSYRSRLGGANTGNDNSNNNKNIQSSPPPAAAAASHQGASSRRRRQESLNVGRDPLLSLNLNLDALACGNAPERAQELYRRISALYREGYYAAKPDGESCVLCCRDLTAIRTEICSLPECKRARQSRRIEFRSY